jgi:hypothetical protein
LTVRDARGEHATYGEAVEYLCVHARALREKIDVGVWSEAIGVIKDTVTADEAWHDAVRRLHKAAEDAGMPGGIGLLELRGEFSGRYGFPSPPVDRTTGWMCPSRRCTRVELRNHATATPACEVADGPMRPVD